MHSTIDAKRLYNKVTMFLVPLSWNFRISTNAQSCTYICTNVQIKEGTSGLSALPKKRWGVEQGCLKKKLFY
jgi:hypothetical protein